MLRRALDAAVTAVNRGDADMLWLRTGPALLTRAFAACAADPAVALGRLRVLERHALRRFVAWHQPAEYKATPRHWLRSVFPA